MIFKTVFLILHNKNNFNIDDKVKFLKNNQKKFS